MVYGGCIYCLMLIYPIPLFFFLLLLAVVVLDHQVDNVLRAVCVCVSVGAWGVIRFICHPIDAMRTRN